MAFSKKMNESQEEIVRVAVGEFLPNMLHAKLMPEKVELGESFSTYMLRHDHIRARKPIHEAAVDLGQCTQLIYLDDKPLFHVVSGAAENSEWEVLSLVNSPLSYKLYDAIDWADRFASKEVEACLLHVPALYLDFLWIKDGRESSYYALTWQKEYKVFMEQRTFSEHELAKVLFSLGRPRGLKVD